MSKFPLAIRVPSRRNASAQTRTFMPPKKQRGQAVPGAGLARRFSRAALMFLWWWPVVGSSPQLLAATFTTPVTISESDTTYNGQDIVVNGTTLTVNGAHRFASLLLTNAAVLTHSPCTAAATHNLDLTVTNQIAVSAGSTALRSCIESSANDRRLSRNESARSLVT